MKRSFLFCSIGLTVFGYFFSACTTEAPLELESPPPITVAAIPEIENSEEDIVSVILEEAAIPQPSYTSIANRDPFRSIISISEKNLDLLDDLPPLQRNEISDLRLQGIIWGSFGPRAIINTPDGKGYTVRVGTKIGYNHGVIRDITQKKIVIEETVLNAFGEQKKRNVEMELRPQKEG